MTDQPDPDDEIPAFIRAMLDPYVNVAGPRLATQSRQIERTYIAPLFRPTDTQLRAMGRITSTWAVLERVIEIALARLALAPQFPALALTNDLGIDNRIKALKTLISLHHERYRESIIQNEVLTALTKIPAQIATLKDKRNKVAHLVWTKAGDDAMTGQRSRALTMSARSKTREPKMSLVEVNDLADRIQDLADALFVLAQLIPEVDEGPHARSLARSTRHLHRETE